MIRICVQVDACTRIVDFNTVELRWRQVLDRSALWDALDGDQVGGLFEVAFGPQAGFPSASHRRRASWRIAASRFGSSLSGLLLILELLSGRAQDDFIDVHVVRL